MVKEIKKRKYSKPFPVSNLNYIHNSNKILLNPEYQRTPVWTLSQKQLLIDSILRDIDIPKLYFREIDKDGYEYEVVDGQQRLRTIFEFMDNSYKLSIDSDKVDGVEIAGKTFSGFSTALQMAFMNKPLDVVVLNGAYTDDDIEETFLRLQNGTPLNAAEKRRAISGNMRKIVEKLSRNKIFKVCGFSDKRYAYEDAVAKILHIVLNGSITDIKPTSIKKTYDLNKSIKETNPVAKKVKSAFNFMLNGFKDQASPKLKKFSIMTLTYVVIHLMENYNATYYKKEIAKAYLDFELKRIKNEELPEDKQNSELAAYSDAARSDSVANMQYRHDLLLREIVRSVPDLELKDPHRVFSEEQRLAIYIKDKGICKKCGKKCDESDFHADHIKAHGKGGKTCISNGQLLCPKCNLKKKDK